MVSRKKLIKPLKPIFKWAGGKRRLIKDLLPLLPDQITSYCEPFLGGGALLFYLQPSIAYINDINNELMTAYSIVGRYTDELIEELKKYKNDHDFYCAIRDLDRNALAYSNLTVIERAARFIYLNHTCYNGLCRYNKDGAYNVPFGNYKNPKIVDEPALRAVGAYLNSEDVHLTARDYAETLKKIPADTFVYLDPPYDQPTTTGRNFVGYTSFGFGKVAQMRLSECCDELDARGVKFMLSNAATPLIMELYAKYNITTVKARRTISADGSKRGMVDEVVIRNYE